MIGRVSRAAKGSRCKRDGLAFVGSSPTPGHQPTCTYPKCECRFLWCGDKPHPPCPHTAQPLDALVRAQLARAQREEQAVRSRLRWITASRPKGRKVTLAAIGSAQP